MKTDFSRDLNNEQMAAAMAPDGPILVLAAAGTGKTRTIVYRVTHLMHQGIPVDRILLLTFTNRAAGEMLERAAGITGSSLGGIWGGTFHHMANRVMRSNASLLGYPNDYTIFDRDDALSIMSECMKDKGVDTKFFPKKEVLLAIAGSSANTDLTLENVIDSKFPDILVSTDEITAVIRHYSDRKKKMGGMDFDDMLVNCNRLFAENPAVLADYQDRFLHILVDEYQDTNIVQARLVDQLAARNRNVFVVGDDFQSIYSWRGADYRNIISFPEKYSDAKIYKLETNYRSLPGILNVANACIAGNPQQFQKVLRPTRESDYKPRVLRLRDGAAQARQVVEEIHRLRREGYRRSDIAVLYRAHFHAMELQITLVQERIEHVVTSGVRFFEQAHIKDVCALLRILDNPGDELAFLRLVQLYPGVGMRTARKIWTKMGSRFKATESDERKKILSFLPSSAKEHWNALNPIFEAYLEEELFEDAGEVLHRFLNVYYSDYAAGTFENYQRRVDDIRELVLYTAKTGNVKQFLSDVALLTNIDTDLTRSGSGNNDAVTLSTVHQAKGLEWPVVIIVWAVDGMFPSSRSVEESPLGEFEERRLFYVAVTRAKNELIMCVPEIKRTRDGGVIYCQPSRFVQEIPDEYLRRTYATMV